MKGLALSDVPDEVMGKMNVYHVKEQFREEVKRLKCHSL